MSSYAKIIIEATACNPGEVGMIEDIMRNEIFQSALDWQTPAQLRKGARDAYAVFIQNRDLFETNRAQIQAIFEQSKLKKA